MEPIRIGVADDWNRFHIQEYRTQLAAFPQVQLIEGTQEQLLQDPDVSALLFAPRPRDFYSALNRALDAGKHVFCDKCVSLSESQLRELYQKADAKGLQLAFEFPFLHRPLFRAVRYCQTQDALGTIYSAFFRNAHNGVTMQTLPPQFLEDPHGVIYDIGLHPLYLALALWGVPQHMAAFGTQTVRGSIHTYHAMLSWDACTAVCEGSYCSQDGGFTLALYGTKGCLRADVRGGKLEFVCTPDSCSIPDAAYFSTSSQENDLALWLQNIAQASPTDWSAAELAIQTATLAENIYREIS